LAIFLIAFYVKHVGGTATVIGAIVGEVAVILCAIFTNMAWLWWNVVGCGVGVIVAVIVQRFLPVSPETKSPHDSAS
ncbi:MAG TPA: sodium:solute symporter, partial [Thermoanaerobaculia bacterium]